MSKPFHEIIREISGNQVVPFNIKDSRDVQLSKDINRVCMTICQTLKEMPIQSKRINEVGNKIKPYVINEFNEIDGYRASVPTGKVAGCPDILIVEEDDRYSYIQCKTYNRNSIDSPFRSFYFSGSETFKVKHDARHLVLGFEMVLVAEQQFRPVGFKMVDAYNLLCTLKEEWNSNNRLLYGLPLLLEYAENRTDLHEITDA